MIKYFDGIQYTNQYQNNDDVLTIVEEDNGHILILVKNEGDHPTLINIDLINKTYSEEGYD